MSKTSNGLVEKGDVVWVQYRKDPLWPALIQNVYPKKATYVFFPIPKLDPGKKHMPFSCNVNMVYAMSSDDGLPPDSSDQLTAAYDAAMEYMSEKKITLGSKAPRRPNASQGEAEEEENGSAKEAPEAPVATTSTEEEMTASENTMEDDDKDSEDSEEDEDEEEEDEEESDDEEEKVQPKNRKSRSIGTTKNDSSLEDAEKGEPEAKKMKLDDSPTGGKFDNSFEEVDAKRVVKKVARDVDVFSNLVFDQCDTILGDLWRTPKIRKYTVPRRSDIKLSFPSAKMLTDDDSDRLFDHIVQFIQEREKECRTLPAIHLACDLLFPEVIIRCLQMDRNISYDEAKLLLKSPENGTDSSLDTVVDNHLSSPPHPPPPPHQISGLDALVRVACEERAKTVAANVL